MEPSHKHTKKDFFTFSIGLESCFPWQARYNCIHFRVWRGKRNANNLLTNLRRASCGKTALGTWRSWGDNAELIFRTSFFLWNQSWVEACMQGKSRVLLFWKEEGGYFLPSFFVSQANYTYNSYNSWRGCGAIRGSRSPTAWSTWNSPTGKQQNLLRLPKMNL